MSKALITTKVGMTSIINDAGVLVPVTLLHTEPNVITQIKTEDNDGYNSVQLGAGNKKKLTKSQQGHFKASKSQPKTTREYRLTESSEEIKVGDKLGVDIFEVGSLVNVTGISKGKGWAGTIKRHNFHRGRKTHGGRSYRRVGSIGSMYPQKIFKGKKMAGQKGHEQSTVKNLRVALVDIDKNIIGVKGAVPGPRRSVVIIKGTA